MGKLENIKKLLELNGGDKANEKTAQSIIDSIKHLVPDFKNENVKPSDIKDIVDTMQNETIPIYDKHFTDEEILGIIDFFNTPIGKIYLSKMSTVVMETMQVSSKYGEMVYNRLMEISGTDIKE
jgi:hypothetical protein